MEGARAREAQRSGSGKRSVYAAKGLAPARAALRFAQAAYGGAGPFHRDDERCGRSRQRASGAQRPHRRALTLGGRRGVQREFDGDLRAGFRRSRQREASGLRSRALAHADQSDTLAVIG